MDDKPDFGSVGDFGAADFGASAIPDNGPAAPSPAAPAAPTTPDIAPIGAPGQPSREVPANFIPTTPDIAAPPPAPQAELADPAAAPVMAPVSAPAATPPVTKTERPFLVYVAMGVGIALLIGGIVIGVYIFLPQFM